MEFLKKVNRLVLGLGVLLAIGCGEENKQEDPAPENHLQANCKLTKHSSGQFVQDFIYDNAGKLTRVNHTSVNSPGANSYEEITYNAKGQVFQITSFDKQNVQGNHKVISYNSNVQPDTITHFRGIVNLGYTTYEYNASKQLIRSSVFTPYDSLSLHYTEFRYPAANRSTEMHYKRNADGTVSLDKTTEIVYDDKWHPYFQLGYFYEALLFSTHNVLSSTITYQGQLYTNQQTYSYDYNSEGYPVKQTITSGQSGGQTVNYFTYNCQ